MNYQENPVFIVVTLSGLIEINACKKESSDYADQETCTGSAPTFNGEIATIINTHYGESNCHSANSSNAGINLSTFALASCQF